MEVELKHKQAFIEALHNYVPSPEAVALLSQMPLVILLSVTGGGRNTIINKLVQTGRYHFILSDTTRPPKVRNGVLEQDGVQYHFRREEDVLADIQQGMYLEAELIHGQQVSGTSIRELVRARDSGKVPINEVDLGGTVQIAAAKPDTVFLFVVPPSFDEWMRRLKAREHMSDDELYNRLQTAAVILRTVLASDQFVFVVNDDLDEVVATVDEYVSGHQHDTHNAAAKACTRSIYHELSNMLTDFKP
ncbi:MAG: hypothetical protein WAQ25_04795 [Candidatus Saccharimonas sp.]